MKVARLIEELRKLPADAEVHFIFDGSAYGKVELAWVGRDGRVKLSAIGANVYHDEDRPPEAPSEKEDKYWCAESAPE